MDRMVVSIVLVSCCFLEDRLGCLSRLDLVLASFLACPSLCRLLRVLPLVGAMQIREMGGSSSEIT